MQYKLDQFTWNKKERSLSTFASDLGILAVSPLPREINIKGEHQVVTFRYLGNETDREGDVIAYVYVSRELNNPIRLKLWNT